MCGRFAYYSAHEAMAQLFGLGADAPAIEPRWNIAPTQFVPVVRVASGGLRKLSMLYWGLIPHWAKEKSIGARMINARAETLTEKPSFRTAYRRRRCLVVASGYYEWQLTASGKQPWFIHPPDDLPFGMAGLWESWSEAPDSAPLESCTIITTEAHGPLAQLHHRVPVIVPPADYARWLDPAIQQESAVADLLQAPADALLTAHPVSARVNNARNEGEALVQPLR
jgi:putative SOS response-associated peptidase YedK